MKGLIIYQTKYGSTRQYAQWISEELAFDLADVRQLDPGILNEYDVLVIGSHIHAGRIMIADWVGQNADVIARKKRYFFTVSGTSPQSKALYDLYCATYSDALREGAQFFALHGKMRYEELDRIDKVTMNMGVLISRSTQDRKAMRRGYDHVKKKAVFGLVNAIRKYQKTV